MPSFEHELRHIERLAGHIAGVDEVGRGPLAGPVVAAAIILKPDCIPEGLDDSKKLTEKKREALFAQLMDCALAIGIGEASVDEIDLVNIRQATHLAMARAITALSIAPAFALVDGNDAPALACPCETLIGGDGLSVSIAAASIIAKVTRDRLMTKLHEAHPHYAWDRNKGYGTEDHMTGLRLYGCTPHHRKSFAPVRAILSGEVVEAL
ncbi:ribonuclease HII [Rhizomicrobium palustre]|uniref:Ribonuclease HII n=1 Tax=Rhizomicrobium palustre TaxID=189966 RepID=A0A846N353_9PROT|nr:ribonuclease HII [Rhizomicrobium palustre]NIK90166.1 ribonuclease HII [Rhizomicrobium palustre]